MRDRTVVDAVKAALADPTRVCQALGLMDRAARQARGWLVRCPAHDDGTPSCSVRVGSDGTLAVKCQASCGLSGDIFDLVAAVEGLNRVTQFREVLARAASLANVDVEHAAEVPRRPPPPPPPRVDDKLFHHIVEPMFAMGRLDGAAAKSDVAAYLDGRGLLAEAVADGWAALPKLPHQRIVADAMFQRAGADDVRLTGLFDAADGFAHAEARVCIPWRDQLGRVVTVQRRRLDAGEPRYVGARGRSFAWPYGVERLTTAPMSWPVAFVEGAVDVLALRAMLAERGENVVVLGLPGLGGWRMGWAALARGRLAAVAVDGDEAGRTMVQRIAQDLAAAGATPQWWECLGAKDWADAWKVRQGGAEA